MSDAVPVTRAPLPAVFLTLTFVTGLVDAVSFLGLGHIFTANMTGNIVFLGFSLAGVPGLSFARSLTSLVAFLIGAAIGGRLGVVLSARVTPWLLTAGAIEAALLLLAAVASLGFNIELGTPESHLYAIIVLTALAMGIRNATARRLAVPDLTTTVLTLTLTGLAADSLFGGGNNPRAARRITAVLAMLTGAAIGAWALRYGLALPLLLSGMCVIATSLLIMSHARHPSKG